MILQAYTDVNMMKVHIGNEYIPEEVAMHSDDNVLRDGQ
jgi:hypothetical protein